MSIPACRGQSQARGSLTGCYPPAPALSSTWPTGHIRLSAPMWCLHGAQGWASLPSSLVSLCFHAGQWPHPLSGLKGTPPRIPCEFLTSFARIAGWCRPAHSCSTHTGAFSVAAGWRGERAGRGGPLGGGDLAQQQKAHLGS